MILYSTVNSMILIILDFQKNIIKPKKIVAQLKNKDFYTNILQKID